MFTHFLFYGIVKNAYDGTFRIINHSWDSRLANSSSAMFKELSANINERIHEVLIPGTSFLNNDAEFYVTVLSFQSGSVIVNYR